MDEVAVDLSLRLERVDGPGLTDAAHDRDHECADMRAHGKHDVARGKVLLEHIGFPDAPLAQPLLDERGVVVDVEAPELREDGELVSLAREV